MNATAIQITDVAERMIREGGYHAFSYRQIADELGIKSASIHYHFPSKEDLGLAVATRYSDAFMTGLGDASARKAPLKHYVGAFQAALKDSQRPCLCAILAGESGKLPEKVCDVLKEFTEKNLKWLEKALATERDDWTQKKHKATARLIFSALEGAIVFASTTGQPQHLKQVGDSLLALVKE